MDYSIALRNGMNPSMPLNGCEFNIRNIRNICNNALFEFLFVMPNQKIDFNVFESFIYNKNGCFPPFYNF